MRSAVVLLGFLLASAQAFYLPGAAPVGRTGSAAAQPRAAASSGFLGQRAVGPRAAASARRATLVASLEDIEKSLIEKEKAAASGSKKKSAPAPAPAPKPAPAPAPAPKAKAPAPAPKAAAPVVGESPFLFAALGFFGGSLATPPRPPLSHTSPCPPIIPPPACSLNRHTTPRVCPLISSSNCLVCSFSCSCARPRSRAAGKDLVGLVHRHRGSGGRGGPRRPPVGRGSGRGVGGAAPGDLQGGWCACVPVYLCAHVCMRMSAV